MIIAQPAKPEAYQLLHEGALAFSTMEAAGMRIDFAYLDRTIEQTEQRIARIEERLKSMDEYGLQRKRFGQQTNLTSRDQLATVLFEDMGLQCVKKTKTGKPQLDEESLLATGLSYCQGFLKRMKLDKLLGTYLLGLKRETEEDGYVHGCFNLAGGAFGDDSGGARSYRSSMSDPNLQNVPIRNKEIGELIRRAFIPRDGHVLVETDFGGHEVRVACNVCQDKVLIRDATEGDMHRDWAAKCWGIEESEVTKEIRFYGKNGFVFPQFYGDFHKQIAPNLWEQRHLKTKSGFELEKVLEDQEIIELGDCNFGSDARKGTFEDHLKQVERVFWDDRYVGYRDWRKMRVKQYKNKGWFDLPTGFVCSGVYAKNQVLNYPIQGAAFHCLLWTLIQLIKEMRKKKMRSVVVGQIHDSVVADVHRAEVDDYVEMVTRIAQQDIMQAWKWITVPLVIEAEVAEDNWFNKAPYQKPASVVIEEFNPSACVACGGTGRSSKGGPCVPCMRKKEKETRK